MGVGKLYGQRIIVAIGEFDARHFAVDKMNLTPGCGVHFAQTEVALGKGAVIEIRFFKRHFSKVAVDEFTIGVFFFQRAFCKINFFDWSEVFHLSEMLRSLTKVKI